MTVCVRRMPRCLGGPLPRSVASAAAATTWARTGPMASLATCEARAAATSCIRASSTRASCARASATPAAAARPTCNRHPRVWIRIGKLDDHPFVHSPVATREAASDLVWEGDGGEWRVDGGNGTKTLPEPARTSARRIARRRWLHTIVLAWQSHLPLRKHGNHDGRTAGSARRRAANVDGAGCCTMRWDRELVRRRHPLPFFVGATVWHFLRDAQRKTAAIASDAVTLLSDGLHAHEKAVIQDTTGEIDAFDWLTADTLTFCA